MGGAELSYELNMELDAEFRRLVDSLVAVLAKESVVYEELRTIVGQERQTLKRPSLALLSESNNRKETCILKARMLEEVRASIVRKLARHLDREEAEINVSLLATLVDDEQRRALTAQQEALLALLGAIREINTANHELIDHSLSYVKNSVDFLNQVMCAGAGYARTGKLRTASRNGTMLCKEG